MLKDLDENTDKGLEEIDEMFKIIRRACVTRRKEFETIFKVEVARKCRLFNECFERLRDHHDHSQEGLRLA